MADGAAGHTKHSLQDTVIAVADRYIYEAALTGFYGSISFSFKAGKIVLVRREETLVPGQDLQSLSRGET